MVAEMLATGASDCELVGDGLLAQPVNTVSSLAYVGVAIWIVARFRGRSALAVGTLVASVGIGSVGFHGWDGDEVARLHDLTIAAVLVFVVGFEAGRGGRRRRAAGYGVALVALGVGLAASLLGRTGAPLCAAGSLIQWHALWHVATAVVLGAWAWGALGGVDRGEVRWGGSTARPRSSPVPARGSAAG